MWKVLKNNKPEEFRDCLIFRNYNRRFIVAQYRNYQGLCEDLWCFPEHRGAVAINGNDQWIYCSNLLDSQLMELSMLDYVE